jgi:hypothetical protein
MVNRGKTDKTRNGTITQHNKKDKSLSQRNGDIQDSHRKVKGKKDVVKGCQWITSNTSDRKDKAKKDVAKDVEVQLTSNTASD